MKKLDTYAREIIKKPNTSLKITGYTDSIGTIPYNQELSENRAKAVSDYLKSINVPNEIVYSGKGIAITEQDNELNRYVKNRNQINKIYFKNKQLLKALVL